MKKSERLAEIISANNSLLIAYSGGVDSTLLAYTATKILGREHVKCVLLNSPVVPAGEIAGAGKNAEELGLNLEIVTFPVLGNSDFRANTPERCYICKKASAKILRRIAQEAGIKTVADGVNLSDTGRYRPGIAACDEEGIIHPLAEAGLEKKDVRLMARELGLPVWSKPSAACLASRIPYFDQISEDKLEKIETAEEFLKDLFFDTVRVRMHGDIARIEIPPGDFERILEIRDRISGKLKETGFRYVTLDIEGYRSGSMDEVL